MSQTKRIFVGDKGLSFLDFTFVEENGTIKSSELKVVGGPELLELASQWRDKLVGASQDWQLPEGDQLSALLMRELILKVQENWKYPYCEAELCHCRAVPTEKVDQAILYGAHTPAKVSAQTSASTSCGSCQGDVEAILEYRLKVK